MFEAVELARTLDKNEFKQQEIELRTNLLLAQLELAKANVATIVLVHGVPGAGREEVVDRLHKWLDTRGIRTHAFWDETDEDLARPPYWRFWQSLPPRGSIGILFGGWYAEPVARHALNEIDDASLDQAMQHAAKLEGMLTQDGALVLKVWLHISAKTQAKRLKKRRKVSARHDDRAENKRLAKRYRQFIAAAERVIRSTDSGAFPWYLVESDDKNYRDIEVGRTLLSAMHRRLADHREGERRSTVHELAPPPPPSQPERTILDQVDLSRSISDEYYRTELSRHQKQLRALAWEAYDARRSTVCVLEGWDAAGKGGTLRRITAAVDSRLFRAISVAAPTDEELAHHYLWRFWRQIPRAGYMTLYDRSWYGRVLVERVEGFAQPHEWMRAYQEINDFEDQLVDAGIVLCKFWIHIDADEQLRRFKEREQIPWKRHKIGDEDWRNREKWDAYTHAVSHMVEHTSTSLAPWKLVAGNDKRHARVTILKALCERIESALGAAR